MKIAFVVNEIRLDGIAVYCARLARELPCEVVLITSANSLPDDEDVRWIIESFDEVVMNPDPVCKLSLRNINGLAKLFRSHKIDVIHVHELHLLKTISPAAKLARISLVGTSHLASAGSSKWNQTSKKIFAMGLSRFLCDRYFAISTEIKNDFLNIYRIHPSQIRMTLPGIDVEHFRPATADERRTAREAFGLRDDELVILQVGRLADVKQPLLTLDAFEAFLKSNPSIVAKLLFAGTGPLQTEIENQIRERKLEDRVNLLGFVDAREAFWAADVMALPSDVEGCALVAIEAMACGVVPIRSMVGGYLDQIADGVNGYGIEPRDHQALTGKFESLIDTAQRQVISQAALTTAREKFDIRGMGDTIYQAYREVSRAS